MALVVVSGPPGAGKSTVAKLLADRSASSALVVGDVFFSFLASGLIEPWLPEAHRQNETVVRSAAAASGTLAADGFDTVYDGVVGPWFLPTFHAAAGGGELDYAVLLPSVEVCLDRVRTRLGHGFTDEGATRSMHREFATADLDGRHLFVDPPGDPAAVADLVAQSRAAGRLRVHHPPG